jgi:hypothetical protein
MTIRYYISILLLLVTVQLFAQDVKFKASASKTTVGTGEQFQISYSVNGNADGFGQPDLGELQVLSGPNVSTYMEFDGNGNRAWNTTYSYILVAAREGSFNVSPASIVVNGRKYMSNAIKITVVKGRQAVPQQSRPAKESNTSDLSKLLFLRTIVDKTDVYQGQQISLIYRVYTRVDILQNQMNKMPDLTGFWAEEVRSNQPAQFRIETYKGQRYNVADIRRVVLFPEHAGNIAIEPFSMEFLARVQTAPSDFMDQFFGDNVQEVNYTAKSLPVVIHVKPLPDASKPADYTGAVGKFSIQASVDRNQLKANEALNYKVKVSGSGNIKLLKEIKPAFPADFEKYDPKLTDSVNITESGLSGFRTYNYLVIPRHKGDFTIEPLKFSYFNPAIKKYVTLQTEPFKIKVDKGDSENTVASLSGEDKQEVKLLDKDIHYIKTGDARLTRPGDEFYGSTLFYLLLLLGPVTCIGAFFYRNKLRQYNADPVKVKSRTAGKQAAKHLAFAQKELQADNTKTFYEEVFKGLYGYLSNKLNIAYADLDRETIASALKARSVSDSLISQLLETLDLCEMARYAPVTHILPQDVFEKAKNAINAIEHEI